MSAARRTAHPPGSRLAEVVLLHTGYVEPGVASTVSYVRDARAKIIIDPGMVPSPRSILNPLRRLGVAPGQITDVVFSHHHPDHTLHAALFSNARVHDHWAIYQGDRWESRGAEGFQISPHVRLLETPGHTPQDITTVAETEQGAVAFTHLWWGPDGPAEDPYAPDPSLLHRNRARVLGLARRIVPGHGPAFEAGPDTPR